MTYINFEEPVRDSEYDPQFKVTSKTPYKTEIATRKLAWDYWIFNLPQQQTSDVLQKLGKNIEEIDQLLCDARVKAALNNRRAGTLSLKWTIDENRAPARVMKLVEGIFKKLPVYDMMSEILIASLYGYNVSEINWIYKDGLWIPSGVQGKAARWFCYSPENELRIKTKAAMVVGEPLPPRKFLVTRYHPRYDDPMAGREALFNGIYWPVIYRRILMQYSMQFLDKYGMPWFDVSVEGGLQQDRLQEIVDSISQTYQDGILAHPDNSKIQKLDMGDAKTVDNYTQMLDYFNREIDMCILGNNLSTEVQGGSFAAANAHMGVRDDIIQEDSRMVEATINQLIEWICYFNFKPSDIPVFRLYKSQPPTRERIDIDVGLAKLGVKFKPSYFCRTYGLNTDEFDIGLPVQDLNPGMKGIVAGAEQSDGLEAVVESATDTARDQAVVTK